MAPWLLLPWVLGTSLMRNFDLFFEQKRPSFVFLDTRLTQRRLSESYSWNRSQDLRNQRIRVLRDATHLWYSFHNSYSIFVVAFSSFVGMVVFFWLFINLMMREQTLIPCLTTRFCSVKLTLGRMPIFI